MRTFTLTYNVLIIFIEGMGTSFVHNHFKSERGFSLVEILVGLGIMSIVVMGLISLVVNQNKEVKSIDEKMGLQSVQTMLTNVLSSPAYCKCFIGAHTFNYNSKAWNSFPDTMESSYDAACAPVGVSPIVPLIKVGTQKGSVLPTSIGLQNMTESTVGSGIFSGNLVIQFDQSLLTRSRKSISIPLFVKINLAAGAPTARPLDTCSSSTSGSTPVDIATLCGQLGGIYNAAATPPCQPTYQ